MSPAKKKTAKRSAKSEVWSAEEKAAMREAARERKAAKGKVDGEKDLLAKLAAMKEPDRAMGRRLHDIIKAAAPALAPKTWYGMPAYANAEGKVVCFFQSAAKFKTRYSTLGFQDPAHLDDGDMWPVSFALRKLGGTEETRITALVKKAVG